jgi:hypothetical protein
MRPGTVPSGPQPLARSRASALTAGMHMLPGLKGVGSTQRRWTRCRQCPATASSTTAFPPTCKTSEWILRVAVQIPPPYRAPLRWTARSNQRGQGDHTQQERRHLGHLRHLGKQDWSHLNSPFRQPKELMTSISHPQLNQNQLLLIPQRAPAAAPGLLTNSTHTSTHPAKLMRQNAP